jgi:hypothetical protein
MSPYWNDPRQIVAARSGRDKPARRSDRPERSSEQPARYSWNNTPNISESHNHGCRADKHDIPGHGLGGHQTIPAYLIRSPLRTTVTVGHWHLKMLATIAGMFQYCISFLHSGGHSGMFSKVPARSPALIAANMICHSRYVLQNPDGSLSPNGFNARLTSVPTKNPSVFSPSELYGSSVYPFRSHLAPFKEP